jgi:hypothetical protein
VVGDEIEHELGEKPEALTGSFYHPGNPVRLLAMHHHHSLPVLLALVAALLGVAHAAGSAAQTPLHAAIAAQSMIYADAGAARGCGLRLFAAHIASNLWIVAVETTLDIYTDGTAAFKGGVFEFAAPAQGRSPSPAPVAIEAVWAKSPEMGMTTPVLGKMDKGAGGYSLRYATGVDSAIAVLLSAMKGESILFGFRRTGHPDESTYVGTPKLAREEIEPLQRCIANLTK